MGFYKRLQHVASVKKKYQADIVADLKKDRPTVSRWWNGGVVPGPKNMRLLADYFECDVQWLETGNGDPFPSQPATETPEEKLVRTYKGNLTKSVGIKWKNKTEPPSPDLDDDIEEHDDPGEVVKKLADEVKAELMRQTSEILDSETVYQPALISNIRAFHHGVKKEASMKSRDDMMLQMMQVMKDLQEQNKVLSERLGIIEDEKKRAGNDH